MLGGQATKYSGYFFFTNNMISSLIRSIIVIILITILSACSLIAFIQQEVESSLGPINPAHFSVRNLDPGESLLVI